MTLNITPLCSFSCVQLFVTPWTLACQVLCPWNSPGKNTGVGCHSFFQMEPGSPSLQADSLLSEPAGKPSLFLCIAYLRCLFKFFPHLSF